MNFGNETVKLDRSSSPFDVINWLKSQYSERQIVLTTSFGMEGCSVVEMLYQSQFCPTIADVDTGFLFEETKQLRKVMHRRYTQFPFETWQSELTPQVQAKRYGEGLWQRDPNLCCRLRKVQPLAENLRRFQVWITAIRKSQSEARGGIEPIQWDWQQQILKVCPLANWERSDVWRYVEANEVPFNELHRQGFPSIGCTHCTRKVDGLVSLSAYSRAGRWAEHSKTECGLHFDEASTEKSEASCAKPL